MDWATERAECWRYSATALRQAILGDPDKQQRMAARASVGTKDVREKKLTAGAEAHHEVDQGLRLIGTA